MRGNRDRHFLTCATASSASVCLGVLPATQSKRVRHGPGTCQLMSQLSHVEELRTWFEEKVTENYRLFYSIATSVLKSSHEAEEAVQEAVLKAWRSLDGLEDPAALVAWVARITRNVALDLKKKRQPASVDWTDMDANATQDPATPDPDRHDDRAYLVKLIGDLPDSQSVVVTLRFL